MALVTLFLAGLVSIISISIRLGNDDTHATYAGDENTSDGFDITDIVSTTTIEPTETTEPIEPFEVADNIIGCTLDTDANISTELNEDLATTEEVVITDTQSVSQSAPSSTTEAQVATASTPTYDGGVLTASKGVNYGPSGKETYYNLDMSGCIDIMRSYGNTDEYWVRDDGCKMLGPYIMCAANLDVHPRGSLVESSLGTCIVVDTGSFAYSDPTQIDIAVTW